MEKTHGKQQISSLAMLATYFEYHSFEETSEEYYSNKV